MTAWPKVTIWHVLLHYQITNCSPILSQILEVNNLIYGINFPRSDIPFGNFCSFCNYNDNDYKSIISIYPVIQDLMDKA